MPFVKGQSGNPKGAPKKEQTFSKCFEDAVEKLKSELKNDKGETVDKIKGKKVVVQAYMDLAFNKKYQPQIRLKALDTIVSRIDGEPRVNVSAEVENTNKPLMDSVDISKLSKEEKAEFEKTLKKALKA